jgi:dihydroorotate dehydrogenase (NAD+) catalytic subunit
MIPFYDPTRSYEDNYDNGPFGIFPSLPKERLKGGKHDIFGIPIDIPFGIPSGPLLNSAFIEASWRWGFSLATYKTVRGNTYPCHPHPNIIRVSSKHPEIHPGDTVIGNLDMGAIDVGKEGITNSFGVPSKDPSEWQCDVKKTLGHMQKGNALILSFMGTKTEHMDRREYIEDFAKTCVMARQTGAPILEVNFSCPNFGKEGLICNDVSTSRDILEALHISKGNIPLLVKIGYFPPDTRNELNKLLEAIQQYADGVVAINTVTAKVVDKKGNQMLPGSPVRLTSGICGAAIRWAGFEMSTYIVNQKRKNNWKDFVVIGVGGVTSARDYDRYMSVGVDAVQSATGAIWNPQLAINIRNSYC